MGAGCGGAPPQNKPQFRAAGWSAWGAGAPISLHGQWESAVDAAYDTAALVWGCHRLGLRAIDDWEVSD